MVHFGILIHVLSWRQLRHQCSCFHYWDYLTNFWCYNWWSIIDVLERLCLWFLKYVAAISPEYSQPTKTSEIILKLFIHSFTNFYFVFKLIQMIRGSFESRSLILGQCIEFTKPGCRNCNFPSKDNHFANPLVVKRTQSRSLQRPKNYIITIM